jgi:hypothetical protein
MMCSSSAPACPGAAAAASAACCPAGNHMLGNSNAWMHGMEPLIPVAHAKHTWAAAAVVAAFH